VSPAALEIVLFGALSALLAAIVLLLAGRARRRAVLAAVLQERRRVARSLHDGVAQDLAFIASRARYMAQRGADGDGLNDIADSAVRALDESRRAIATLRRPEDLPFREMFDAAALELEHREGARLRYRIPPDFDPPAASREALLNIVREAVTNAARHARASEVEVELSRDRDVHMRIRDNGIGFDPLGVRGGFGLAGMRERALALGGELKLSSRPGAGTEIDVVLP
jgi:signal transduction histidine kinase